MAATATANLDRLHGARPSLRRRATNVLASVGMVLAFLIASIPLAFIIGYVVKRGASILSIDFLTQDIPRRYPAIGPGMGPAVYGTLIITGFAALLSIPLGILGAIYLNEYGKKRPLARFVRFMTDVMTGVPSVVLGLFIYTIFVIKTHQQTGFAAALALACLMLPIVIRSTEEMLRLVPDELRQASQALGSRTWRTTIGVVIPAALPGIVSGCMLAIARAAGETAPIVIVAGITFETNHSLFSGQNTTLAAQIFRNANKVFPGAQDRAFGAALTLIILVFVFTIAARIVSSRFALAHRA